MVTFKCECGKSFKVDQRLAGKLGRCPGCGVTVRIPGRETPPPIPASRSDGPQDAPATIEVAPVPPEPRRGQSNSPSKSTGQAHKPETDPLIAAAQASAESMVGGGLHTAGRSLPQGLPFPLLEVIAGCAILLTIVVPWTAMFGKAVMSWDVLGRSPACLLAFVIVAWIIGFVSVILAISLRQAHAALAHAILGLVGVLHAIVLAIVLSSMGTAMLDEEQGGGKAAACVLMCFNVVAWLGVIITSHLRLELGDRTGLRVPQGIFGLLFTVVSILNLVVVIYEFSETPQFGRSKAIGPLIVGIVCSLASVAAGVVIGIHALRTGPAAKMLSRSGLALLYAVTVCTVIYLIVGPAVLLGQAGVALAVVNMMLILLPLGFLLCSGMVKWITHVARGLGQASNAYAEGMAGPSMASAPMAAVIPAPVASTATGAALEVRMHNLTVLRERGVITEQEYNVKRARMLEDM